MVIILEKLFIAQLQGCPLDFQKKFRKIYQQLKIVDKVTEVKNIFPVEKKFYKIIIDKSRIALKVENDVAIIGNFLYNQYYKSS